MIKALSLAAALSLLPISAAVATDLRGPSEDALEAAAEAFGARMESFGERAEALSKDTSLTELQRETRIAALWAEYQPDVDAFTAVAAEHASSIAAEALADIDIDAIVAEAMAEVDVDAVVAEALAGVEASGALRLAQGAAVNGAWASNDPEHLATYGLVAEYALAEAMDSVDAAVDGIEVAVDEIEADDETAEEAHDNHED
ncbi:MAG TPA: hypothetical protein VFF48_08845 [Brevundimonas sp.]|nr:hypothetical protein [Brevundimonas sp.]